MYRTLADQLRQEIETGRHAPGQLIASEHDLARQHQVSRVTVRRASEHLIGLGLIERRPGKGLFVAPPRRTETGLIQFVAGNLAWTPCVVAARAVQVAARTAGMPVQIYDAHGSMAEDLALIAGLPDSPARGAVITGLHAPAFAEVLYGLKQRDFPFVLIDQRLRDLDVPAVVADNHDGGVQVGRALCGLGHQRIAFIGDLAADTVQRRLEGLRDAMGDAGLPFDRRLVANIDATDPLASWTPLVEARTQELMAVDERPTAIFASCDAIARDVITALSALGLSVPGDVSVAGFDDDPVVAQATMPLASVRQDFQAMGQEAFALLHRRMLHPRAPVEHRMVPVTFIARDSIGPAPRTR